MASPTNSRETQEWKNRMEQRDRMRRNVANSTLVKKGKLITAPIIYDLTAPSETRSK